MNQTEEKINIVSVYKDNNTMNIVAEKDCSRYEILIFKDNLDNSIVVSVPNLFISIRNNCLKFKKLDISYKLMELEIPQTDSNNIEMICNYLINRFNFI